MRIKAPRVRELEYKKDGATYQSYQVIWKDHEGRRQRKQFADHNEAALFSSEKHTALLNRESSHRNVSTILSEPDIREAESCITRLGGKYKLAEAVDFFLKHFHEPDFKITVSEASVKFRASLEGRVRDRTLVQIPNCSEPCDRKRDEEKKGSGTKANCENLNAYKSYQA
jgi:hypothetical protein